MASYNPYPVGEDLSILFSQKKRTFGNQICFSFLDYSMNTIEKERDAG